MKLTAFLVSAVLALGVAAIDPEAGSNDVEVRDFSSSETLNEFEARDEDDLEVRNYGSNPCKGKNVEYKEVDYKKECVCTLSGQYYDKYKGCVCKHGEEYSWKFKKCVPDCQHGWEYSPESNKCIPHCEHGEYYNKESGKCEKPFSCKGKNVKVVEEYGHKVCKCELSGQVYNKWKGCECKDGEEYSWKYKKCIPECKHGEYYNPKSGKCEKPFSCKGKNVKVVEEYGHKVCKCELTGQFYDKYKGCECKDGEEYSWKYKKCIPECKHGEYYNPKSGKCEKPFSCKGKNVKVVEDGYGHKSCQCELSGQVYDKYKGCECKKGYEFSYPYKRCIPECKYGEKFNGFKCAPICKGTAWYKHGKCECKADQYYDEHYGCKDRCPSGTKYDWSKKECVCDTYGEIYGKHYKKCYAPCKGKDVKLEWPYGKPTCVCTKEGYEYTKWGCKSKCSHGQKWDEQHKQCYKPCGKYEVLEWAYGKPKCVCKEGYKPTKWGCKKDGY